MPRIVMPPEEVLAVARQFAQQREAAETQIRMLQSLVDSLVWEGVTKESFRQRFEEARKKMQQFVQLQEQVKQELEVIANRFSQADEAGRR